MFNGRSPYRLAEVKSEAWEFFHYKSGRRLVVFHISPRNISSSAVREKLAHGKPTKNLFPPEVEAYIIKHQIYQTKF